MTIRFRSLDDAICAGLSKSATDQPFYDEFELIGRVSVQSAFPQFVPITPETDRARAAFDAAATQATDFPIGRVTLNNVLVVGSNGLIVDLDYNACWLGFHAGWPEVMARAEVERNPLFQVNGLEGFDLSREFQNVVSSCEIKRLSRGHVLSGPGSMIYGHWLVDFSHRFEQLRSSPLPYETIILKAKAPNFAETFMQQFLDTEYPVESLDFGSVYHVDRLTIDTLPRHGQVIDTHSAQTAWAVLEEGLSEGAALDDLHEKLFVSRGRWPATRRLSNSAEIEELARALGWQVIYPEEHSLADQIVRFGAATHIVGEDGSGLHNVIFAHHARCLGVINSGRCNLFHASIAGIRGLDVAYLDAIAKGGGFYLEPAAFDAFLRNLIQ